mmetsp:Transcript_11070/g.18101  ORF Transcript_11070/g.18101 Transcript_11070/m.18101 type:complete len:135 (-) Transcript_11070:15-419(-)
MTSATNPKTVEGSSFASTNDALVAKKEPTAALSEAPLSSALTPPPTLRTVAPVAMSVTTEKLATTAAAELLLAARTTEVTFGTAVLEALVPKGSTLLTPVTSTLLVTPLFPATDTAISPSVIAVLKEPALLAST